MDNLFDLLEKKIKDDKKCFGVNENKFNSYKIDENHLSYIKEIKEVILKETYLKESGLDKCDFIRLNSYVGSKINTDLRSNDKKEMKGNDIVINNQFKEVTEENNSEFDFEELEFEKIVEDKLLIVDGSSLLSTSFYATARDLLFAKTDEQKEFAYKKLMQTSDGVYTNGVYMFFKTLLPLLERQNITHLAVVLDRSRNTFRRELDPEYKANRKDTPRPLSSQFKLLTEVLKNINIPVFSHEYYEADDFAGSIVKRFEEKIPTYLHTKDEDYIQLVSEYTKLWMVTGKAEDMYNEIGINRKKLNIPNGIFEYTPKYVKHFKGIDPIQIIDLKAIEGDKSDNIKGVKNVGKTSSVPLVAHYGSIEEIYINIEGLDTKEEKQLLKFFKEGLGMSRSPIKNMLIYKEDAFLSKKLATIKTDIDEVQTVELEDLILNIDKEKMSEVFKELGMNSLIKKK
ncbi:MAG: 5'-3' exonuclease H3TH domain-containing protein [Clostridia bacterium]